jgi:hypothetical protein
MSIAYPKIMLRMKLISQKVILCTLLLILVFSFCFAYSITDVQQYVNKRVIVSFVNDDGHLIVVKGKVLLLVKPSNDYTIDDYYAYLIVETIDSLEVVRIREIQLIKELK